MSFKAVALVIDLRGVSCAEKMVLVAIANYADERMHAFPSQARLAADSSLSERQVRRVLQDLEERGMISRKRRQMPDGTRISDMIALRLEPDTMSGKPIKNLSAPSQKASPSSSEPRARRRCPGDWTPSESVLQVAEEMCLTPAQVERELATMRDHEFRDAHRDWDAVARNWLRKAKPDRSTDPPLKGSARHADPAIALALERLDERRG